MFEKGIDNASKFANLYQNNPKLEFINFLKNEEMLGQIEEEK
jgi:hypothetical protein